MEFGAKELRDKRNYFHKFIKLCNKVSKKSVFVELVETSLLAGCQQDVSLFPCDCPNRYFNASQEISSTLCAHTRWRKAAFSISLFILSRANVIATATTTTMHSCDVASAHQFTFLDGRCINWRTEFSRYTAFPDFQNKIMCRERRS